MHQSTTRQLVGILRGKTPMMYTRLLQPPKSSFFLFGPRGTGKSTWDPGVVRALKNRRGPVMPEEKGVSGGGLLSEHRKLVRKPSRSRRHRPGIRAVV